MRLKALPVNLIGSNAVVPSDIVKMTSAESKNAVFPPLRLLSSEATLMLGIELRTEASLNTGGSSPKSPCLM